MWVSFWLYPSPTSKMTCYFQRAKRIFHEDHLLSSRYVSSTWITTRTDCTYVTKILDRNPEAHKQRRKLLSRGFSQSAMFEFEPQMDTKIAALLDQWTKLSASGQVLDFYPWAHWLGFDIVCKSNRTGSALVDGPSPETMIDMSR